MPINSATRRASRKSSSVQQPLAALPQAHRDADHVVARFDQQRRRQRAVDAAAHGDHDTPSVRTAGAHASPIAGAPYDAPADSPLRATARMRSTTRRTAATAASMSANVVAAPRLNRTPPRASPSSQPIA